MPEFGAEPTGQGAESKRAEPEAKASFEKEKTMRKTPEFEEAAGDLRLRLSKLTGSKEKRWVKLKAKWIILKWAKDWKIEIR